MPSAVRLLVAHDPVHRPLHPRVFEMAEPSQHPHRVAGEARLASTPSEVSGRTAEAAEEQVHALLDARVRPRYAEVGEDEQPPVRRDVLGPVQVLWLRPRRGPLAPGVLLAEDLGSPSFPADLRPGTPDIRVVLGPVHDLAKDSVADAGVRVLSD